MERILAIQIKRIGDLVLTAPALSLLRRRLPDTHVTLITLGAAGELVPCLPGVDEHFSYQKGRPNLALLNHLLTTPFDVSLDFNGNDRAAFLTLLSQAGTRVAYEKWTRRFPRKYLFTHSANASVSRMHTVDHMVALLGAIGIQPDAGGEPFSLSLPLAVEESARQHLRTEGLSDGEPFVLIHPGTARAEKYWMADRWAEVVNHLNQVHGLPVVFTGGRDPLESEHLANISQACHRAPLNLAGRLTLLESAAVIAKAHAALGVDTAAMHLAAAFQRPQLVLYGATNPFPWRPRHAKGQVLYPGFKGPLQDEDFDPKMPLRQMSELKTDGVIPAVDRLLETG